MPPEGLVTQEEIVMLLLNHLQSRGFVRAAHAFRRELREREGLTFRGIPPGIKCLQEILAEYVQLKEREGHRARFLASNSLARSLQGMLDRHAGLSTAGSSGAPPPPPPPRPPPPLAVPQEAPPSPDRRPRRRRGAATPRKRARPASDVADVALAELEGMGGGLSLGALLADEGLTARLGARLAGHINAAPAQPASPPLLPHPPSAGGRAGGGEDLAPHHDPALPPLPGPEALPGTLLRLPDLVATSDFWGADASKLTFPLPGSGEGHTLFASLLGSASRDGLASSQRWNTAHWHTEPGSSPELGRKGDPRDAARRGEAGDEVALAAWPCITPRGRGGGGGGGAGTPGPSHLGSRDLAAAPSRLGHVSHDWPHTGLHGLEALVEDCIGY